ncbi:MAG: hypothetical protein CVV27_04755 [Candidatus Melainabacteria bacterium HGW-Melainabacteria-1]|nr:MAG: hypothetical protein CVV27_04755 [Candidatus Melainabacteria bacterium HGW-Melainabacteria-1]
MSSLSISALENQLLEKIFNSQVNRVGASLGQIGLAELGAAGGLQQTQKHMMSYAFKDFVNYFLQLGDASRNMAQRRAESLPAGAGPLHASPLHLSVQIERYQQIGAVELAGSQPVTVQKLQTQTGVASRIEIRTPQLHADGVVSYNVTVLKLAVSIEDVYPRPDLAQGTVLGRPLVEAATATAGEDLEEFLNRSPFSGTAESIWDYEHDDAMDLIEEQEQLDAWREEKQMQMLIHAAYQVLKYLQTQELGRGFEMSENEKKLFEEALRGNSVIAANKMLVNFLKKKRVELEMLRKELQERKVALEDSHKIARAQEHIQKLLNVFDKTQKLLDQPRIDPGVLAGLLEEFNQLNLQGSAVMV